MLALLILAAAVGCVAPERTETIRDKNQIVTIRSKDRALARMELGLAALRKGDDHEAETHFDKAMGISGGIIANDFKAKLARSYFWDEQTKTYIGEPYERALCFFYRGLLYWKSKEYDNARACFRSAVIHGGQGEEFTPGDFVLFDYLDGFASYLLHQEAGDQLKRARNLGGQKALPDFGEANLYLFFEIGEGPIKVAKGRYDQELRYERPTCEATGIRFSINGQKMEVPLWDDIVDQASRHGRREMNRILAEKAKLKGESETRANILLSGGTIRKTNWWGTSSTSGNLPGMLSDILSKSTKPRADTRSWGNLPQHLAFSGQSLPFGSHTLQIEFLNQQGIPLEGLTQSLSINVPEKGSTTAFIYTPGRRSGPSRRLAAGLEDLFKTVPDGRAFPLSSEIFQAPSDAVWEAVAAALEQREKSMLSQVGLQANKDTGLIMTRVTRHGMLGFPLYRQYLVEVRPNSPKETELRFVQLLYRMHALEGPNAPVSQSSISNAKEGRGRGSPVSATDQPAFQIPKGRNAFVEFNHEFQPLVHEREKKAFLKAVREKLR